MVRTSLPIVFAFRFGDLIIATRSAKNQVARYKENLVLVALMILFGSVTFNSPPKWSVRT